MQNQKTPKKKLKINYREDIVQIQIVRDLRKKGFLFTSQGAGLIKSENTQKTANRLGYCKGSPDLIVWVKGGTLNIEVKRPALMKYSAKSKRMIISEAEGSQTPSQKEFEAKIKTIPGHYYIVAKSVADVEEFIIKNKIIPC